MVLSWSEKVRGGWGRMLSLSSKFILYACGRVSVWACQLFGGRVRIVSTETNARHLNWAVSLFTQNISRSVIFCEEVRTSTRRSFWYDSSRSRSSPTKSGDCVTSPEGGEDVGRGVITGMDFLSSHLPSPSPRSHIPVTLPPIPFLILLYCFHFPPGTKAQ